MFGQSASMRSMMRVLEGYGSERRDRGLAGVAVHLVAQECGRRSPDRKSRVTLPHWATIDERAVAEQQDARPSCPAERFA